MSGLRSGARSLNAAAAAVLSESGRRMEAMQHWFMAERWSEAALLLTGLDATEVPATNAPDALGQLVAGLPPEVQAEPPVRLARGMFEWAGCRYRAALPALTDAADAFAQSGDLLREWRARILQVDALYEIGEFEQAIAVADATATTDPEATDAADVQVLAGMAEAALGRLDRATARVRAAEVMPTVTGLPYLPAFEASGIDVVAGRFDRALERARDSADEVAPADQMGLAPYVFGSLAHVNEVVGFDGTALTAIERAGDCGRPGPSATCCRSCRCSFPAISSGRAGSTTLRSSLPAPRRSAARAGPSTTWR